LSPAPLFMVPDSSWDGGANPTRRSFCRRMFV
jgi:hypothetical protein